MIEFMLDSNICIAAMRGLDVMIADRLDEAKGKLSVSTVTMHELYRGAEKSNRPEHERGRILALSSLVTVFDYDQRAAEHSGQIHSRLVEQGKVIGAYDMLIAGHARSRDLIIVTNNLREFTRIEGLVCEDWLAAA